MIMNHRGTEAPRIFELGILERRATAKSRLVARAFFFLCASVPLWFKAAEAQTLSSETQRQINAILDAPNLREAHIGISILDLGTVKDASTFPAKAYIGKPYRVLFERDANKSFMPASNMKLFTAAIALQLLGKEKTFPTRLIGHGLALRYVRISGGGDPSLSCEDIQDLADRVTFPVIRTASIISEGQIYSAETTGGKYPFGWAIDDVFWYYGPEISALAVNRNQLDIVVTGAAQRGSDARVDIKPAALAEVIKVVGRVQTGEPNLIRQPFEELIQCQFYDELNGGLILEVEGKVAPGQILSEGLPVPSPQNLSTQLFLRALFKKKHDDSSDQDWRPDLIPQSLARKATPLNYEMAAKSSGNLIYPEPQVILAQHNSPPLKVLFQRFLKNSDNLYAEMLLRDAAYYYDGTGGDQAGPRAHELLKKWLIGQGIDITALRFEDGSGLSRYNLLTPRATAELLAAINAMKDGDVIWNALPIGGVDGTMKNRVKSTPAENNARAKSGTFSIASNLSGYVTTRDNHRLAVSLYMNFARDGIAARKAQDAVFAALANARIQIAKLGVVSRSRSTPALARR